MAHEKSSNSKTSVSVGTVMRRTFGICIPATAALSTALAVVFAIALDGCSGSKDNKTNTSLSSSGSSTPAVSSLPDHSTFDHQKKQSKPVTTKKRSVEWWSPVSTYADNASGVSFRYPRQYTLVTPEKAALNSKLLDRVPMNFVQPGGVKVATLTGADPLVTPLLGVNMHKGLTPQQCEQFADPDPAYVGRNLPLDPIDNTLPSKVKVHDIDFMHVDNGTDQTDTQYYHHFENGTCYEFVVAVLEKPAKSDKPDNTAMVDHKAQFNELKRIMSSVAIKPEASTTASVAPKSAHQSKPQ